MAQTMQLTELIKRQVDGIACDKITSADYISSCLTSGDYSDLTIKCADETFNVHKIIVCMQVEFFARAVKFGGKETQENVIYLPDDDPKVIYFLLRYLYTGQYDSELLGPPDPARDEPLEHPKLAIIFSDIYNAALGRKYSYAFPHSCNLNCTGVCDTFLLCPHHICDYNCKNDCKGFICKLCCIPEAVALHCLLHSKMYAVVDKYNVVGLKELSQKLFTLSCKALWYNDAFVRAIEHAFSTTVCNDLGLRQPIMETIAEHLELMHKPEMQVLMAEHSDLAIGVLLKAAGKPTKKAEEE
ncbi:hypothetical protein CFE70_000466 [Pyrenophora teres f. teres 0-1]|uniref:Uncharacterized protein n=1 Tax=Pyrenophora teres f. teres TaxID=97479 RepID=A0A6S6VFZ0_9PLEO|nr:hypothetical protein HRS9139_04363 [Pyrenophora teres f. teres]KAE8837764.1 hypothetical protein PTNB85_05099 [Pyrenophora teres f. teres]KAE8839816.1 hypothetical protein HRS9122_06421 [Pyrenophora teres f. teres]KAE8862587.1 hypothetical protein PTNB29_05149 [Pyrenophora teres f. teres]KAE8869174.1 hypothetical protein PTNB73_04227 [Pyrenophora teres f. teres]